LSPFCRRCLGIARAGEWRCPLDQEFYLRRNCGQCGQEVYPRELFCAHCRARLNGAPEVLLLPEAAGRGRILAAAALDFLAVGLVVVAQLFWLPLFWLLGVALLAGLLYRLLARSQGRQTFGQAVFHLLTVSTAATPAGYGGCARRTVGELGWLPLSLLRGPAVLDRLDVWSLTCEVRLD
jgi:hypothetical protein